MVEENIENKCLDGKEHRPGFSDYRIYCNGYEIPVSHCEKCHTQIPSDKEIKILEDEFTSLQTKYQV
jgi:hypothetical protein